MRITCSSSQAEQNRVLRWDSQATQEDLNHAVSLRCVTKDFVSVHDAEEHLPNKAVKLIAWQLGNLGNAIWPALEFDTTHIRHTPDTMVELPGSIVQPLQPF